MGESVSVPTRAIRRLTAIARLIGPRRLRLALSTGKWRGMKALLELEARDLPRANEAARLLRLERSGFSHRFARDFGLSWTKLLRQARTEFGTEFRRGHPGVPVKSLARVTGYSETGLYRVFREVRRETPSGKRVVRQQTRVSSVPLRRPVAHIRSSRRLRTVG